MTDESTRNFLEKVTTEKKPLSEKEGKEAMTVASSVWKASMEKISGKDSVGLKLEDPDSRTYIWIHNPRHERSFYNKALLGPDTDLVIDVVRQIKSKDGRPTDIHDFDEYVFTPNKVTKTKTHYSPLDHQKNLDIEDPLAMELADRKAAKLRNQQRTEEKYHPDKEDMGKLLGLISSAHVVQGADLVVPFGK